MSVIFQSKALWSLGYKQETVLAAARAAELVPLEGGYVIRYVFALMNVGQIELALSQYFA